VQSFTDSRTGFKLYGDPNVSVPEVSAERRALARSLGFTDDEIDRLFWGGRRQKISTFPEFPLMTALEAEIVEQRQ
jgi:hypothetical protein